MRGCLNIHASLLPRWRGAAPIHRAIEAGDAETGITIMQMDAGLDTGDMLLVEKLAIQPRDTTASLHDKLAVLGGRLIVEALELSGCGGFHPVRQPDEGVCYAHKIEKAESQIDWRQEAVQVERRLRAFDPFPGGQAQLGGETLKVWAADLVDRHGAPGQVLSVDATGPIVACGRQALRLTELQRAGGKRLPAAALLQARPIGAGEQFDLA
jgi:methionyl-tRNA formyltransferase